MKLRKDWLGRRGYLQQIGAVTAATGVLATGAAASDGADRDGSSEWSPPEDEPIDRDAMTEQRIDPPDEADLADYVEDSGPGELLVVAPGDYRWTRRVDIGWRDWGIQGDPEADGEVTIWLEDGWGLSEERDFPDTLGLLINSTGGTNILVENLHLDSEGRTEPGFRFVPNAGGVLAHRIIDHSRGTTEEHLWGTNTFLLGIGEDAHVMIEGCCQHKRANISYDNNSQSFLWNAGPGELTVRRCKVSGMADNVVYTRMPGPMTIEECVFANTTPAFVRLGGDNEVVRDSTFYWDTDGRELHNRDGTVNMRGICPDNQAEASNGGRIENCSLIVESTPHASASIAASGQTWGTFTGLEIDDCQFLLNVNRIPGINGVSSGTITDTVFDTTTDSGAIVAPSGSWETENVAISDGLDGGEISGDATGSFEWDRAHDFPDPETPEAFMPVGEESDDDPSSDSTTTTDTADGDTTDAETTDTDSTDGDTETPTEDIPGFGALAALAALGAAGWSAIRRGRHEE